MCSSRPVTGHGWVGSQHHRAYVACSQTLGCGSASGAKSRCCWAASSQSRGSQAGSGSTLWTCCPPTCVLHGVSTGRCPAFPLGLLVLPPAPSWLHYRLQGTGPNLALASRSRGEHMFTLRGFNGILVSAWLDRWVLLVSQADSRPFAPLAKSLCRGRGLPSRGRCPQHAEGQPQDLPTGLP